MRRLIVVAALALLPVAAVAADAPVIKVPCRVMDDGRILIDGSYLPDGLKLDGRPAYKIIRTEQGIMQGEWANLICTIRLNK